MYKRQDHLWITGGKPILQSDALYELMLDWGLNDRYRETHICTAGIKYDKDLFDQIGNVCVDIKAPSSGTMSNMDVIDKIFTSKPEGECEGKMVLAGKEDLLLIRKMLDKYPDVPFTVQPMYRNELNVGKETESIKEFRSWVVANMENLWRYSNLHFGFQ